MTGRPWTNHEVRHLEALLARGVANKFIAAQLNRTIRSIQDRCERTGIRRRAKKVITPRKIAAPSFPDQVLLTKNEVPAYYELGWRFMGFEDALCVFEWGGRGEPRYPANEMRRAA